MRTRLYGFVCYILVTLLLPAAKTSAQTNTNCLLVMTCPSNIVVTSCFNVQEFYTPTASNICCGVNSTVTCTPPSGSIFAVGTTTTVTCKATDCAQNTNFCTFTVTVLQGTNCATNCLQIQCPSNIVVTSCTNIQEFYTPMVTDSCCSNWTVVCSPPSGSYFAPGTTNLIDCFVTDYCGMSNSCSFTLTVLQGTNCPTNCLQITCPSNKTVQCGTQWSFNAPTAISCCTNEYGGSTGPGTNVLITPISTMTNGGCPQPTTITQTWSITDLCGDSNTCSQTVTVVGCCTNTNCITLTCPSNIVVTTCSNCVPVFYTARAVNTCCFSNVVLNYSLPSGYCFPLGTTTVTVTATDPDCASTPPAMCSFTVTVNQGTNCCSGPGMGLQSIQWLQLPTNTTRLLPNPTGANGGGTWIITNLPGYGNVLVIQQAPTNVVVRCTNSDFGRIHAGGSFDNPPTSYGYFDFTETGYGPYTWGVLPGSVELAYGFPYTGSGNNLPAYQVSFYFLDGQPNPGSLVFATIGLSMFTTNTLSQPFTFRTEYDLLYDPVNYPQGPSADTVLNGTYGPPLIPGVTGTVISSAYVLNGGDDYNTGYAILQPTNYLLTANLPSGSGNDVNLNPYPSSITNPCPYITVTVNHYIYDIFSTTVGYLCCTNCPTNCLQIIGSTNKTVQCGSNWIFDPPTATSCCTNEFVTGPATETNVLITAINTVTNGTCPNPMQITRTWSIVDGCGESNTWSQTVTVLGCCTNCLVVNCPTNKTVTCDSVWMFDTPTATTCCTNLIDGELGVTNVLITVISTQTNGVCPQVAIIQTCSIVDACGGSNSCSQVVTVTGCCTNTNNCCCGTNAGPREIQWLQCPAANSTPLLADPSGTNASGTWIITNLPCYGNVLVTQTFPDNSPDLMYWFLNPNLENVPAAYGNFVDVEGGYGPYSWGTYGSVLDFYNGQTSGSFLHYNLNFYFLSNAPNPCALYLGVIGLGANTTATVSQPVVFRAEYDLVANAPGGNGSPSANTMLNGVFGPPVAGATGTIVGSAYNTNGVGDSVNTGWAVLQPTYAVNTVSLPGGSGTDVNGNTYPAAGTYSCLTLTVSQQPGDGIGFTVGYVCCTNCSTNCLEVECPTNKTVQCGTQWSFDAPTATSCCATNISGTSTNILITPISTVTNGVCPQTITVTRTWSIVDACGESNNCSQVVTLAGCCTNCLQVNCATNKTVQCGSLWSFNAPTATSCCSNNFSGTSTNVAITTISTITNGVCPQTITVTRTWSIVDACGESNTCSQVVTLAGCCTNCLQVNCATNKTVQCGSSWSFNAPTATSCCTNNISGTSTNVLITVASTVTNGVCPQTITVTRTWSIVDDCGGSNTCSQIVTLAGCCTNCLTVNCPTNKSVQCGSNWTFNTPTATSCCATNFPGTGTNVLITVTSTVTNGVCPQVITQTWAIIDACGESNNCSQIVTVVDTTPPVITCPTNTVVVALNSNCQFAIPTVQVSATDNCTPVCSLIYSQSPTNGTIVSGTNAVVTVTVTDLCGNSNSCHVLVEGKPETGPVVTIPTSIIISNCLVPCLSNYLTASDNCCPASSLKITQSVPCGDLIASGGETVTVTVTDCHGNTTSKLVHLVPSGSNTFLANLTNTGSRVSSYISVTTAPNPNNLQADGVQAVPYTLPPSALNLCSSIPSDYAGYPVAVSETYVPWTLAPDPGNPASGAVSKWIGPDLVNNFTCPCGTYTYSLPFTLPADLVASTATISGRWAADNGAVGMLINSTPTGNVMLPTDSAGDLDGFAHWTYFTINSGFRSGANTLQFVVTNQPWGGIMTSVTGLRVEFTSAYAGCASCAMPSITSITRAQSLQEGSTANFSVNAGGTPPLSYQWQFNGVNIAGANSPTLRLPGIAYSAAGLYTVVISNPCGSVTGKVTLTVTQRLPWLNGSWIVATLTDPLAATFGSDLVMAGSNYVTNFAINVGTTDDFGLPGEGGQAVNVMDINPAAGATIELPQIAEPGSNADTNYTLIMDIYEPDTSLGTPSTLYQSIACCVSNLGSSGQDGVELTLDTSNYLHLTGAIGGTPFDSASTTPMAVDAWHRLTLAVDGGAVGIGGSATLYLDGQTAIAYSPCLCCPFPVPILWTNTGVLTNGTQVVISPTILSVPTGTLATNGEFYVSGIQFHTITMTPQMIAGIGSPASGPAPVNETSVGAAPMLSAALSNGVINLTWSGNAYVLQETSDPGSGVWANSTVPFTETEGPNSTTTATVTPASDGPSKFYRLISSP